MSDINYAFNCADECNNSVLSDIAKARKNIKCTLNLLNNEETHVQSIVEHKFKPKQTRFN